MVIELFSFLQFQSHPVPYLQMYNLHFLVDMLASTAIVQAVYGQSLNGSYFDQKSSLLQPSSISSLYLSSTLVSTDNDSLDGNQDRTSDLTGISRLPARSFEKPYLSLSGYKLTPPSLRSVVQSDQNPTLMPPVYGKSSSGHRARPTDPLTTLGNLIFGSQPSLLGPSHRSRGLPGPDHSMASARLAASNKPSRFFNSTAIDHAKNSELNWHSGGSGPTSVQPGTRFVTNTNQVGALPTLAITSYKGQFLSAAGWVTPQSTTINYRASVPGAFGDPDRSATIIAIADSTLQYSKETIASLSMITVPTTMTTSM